MGDRTQSLLHAGQALYPLGHSLSPNEIIWAILPHGVVSVFSSWNEKGSHRLTW